MANPIWDLRVDGDRAVLRRSLAATFGPYALLLAVTLAWYPLAGYVLAALAIPPGSWPVVAAFSAPIAALGLWVPRLARSRRCVRIERAGETVSLDGLRVPRSHLRGFAIAGHTVLGRRRWSVLAYGGDPRFVHHLVSERRELDAQAIASTLARWLDVPLDRGGRGDAPPAAPPRAIVVARRPRDDSDHRA